MRLLAACACVLLSLAAGKRVRLIVVRHGQSCGNVISEFGPLLAPNGKIQHKFFPDPLLSDCGLARTKRAAAALAGERVDFVASSTMLRAIETAWHQFGARRVHVLPHISEEAYWEGTSLAKAAFDYGWLSNADNTALPAATQVQLLSRYSEVAEVDFARAPAANATHKSSWAHFERYLAGTLLPELGLTEDGAPYTIGLVSHSHFMRRALGQAPREGGFLQRATTPRQSHCYRNMPREGGGKPYNNQALELFYDYDPATGRLELDAGTPCRSLGDVARYAAGVPAKPKAICEADFARCVPLFAPGGPAGAEYQEKFISDRSRSLELLQFEEGCLTAHQCVAAFPLVMSEEQKWLDATKKAQEALMHCTAPADECEGAYERDKPAVPEFPQVCECHD